MCSLKDYNIQYLKTEYNNALRTAQAAGKWKRYEEQKDLFDLQFDTAGDDKVRKHHEELDGITRPVDDAFWNRYYPPIDWACRCTVRQVAKGTTITSDEKLKGLANPPKAFQFNPGKQQLIFSNEHPYIKNLQTFRKSELNGLKDYGLKEVKAIYARGKNLSAPLVNFKTKEDAGAWFDKKATDGIVSLNAKLFKTSFKANLTAKNYNNIVREGTGAKRWEWVNRIPNILLNANEIYLLNYFKASKTKVYRFIKYYQDSILVTNVEVSGDDFEVKTAYKASFKQIEKQRQGVLIKGKI